MRRKVPFEGSESFSICRFWYTQHNIFSLVIWSLHSTCLLLSLFGHYYTYMQLCINNKEINILWGKWRVKVLTISAKYWHVLCSDVDVFLYEMFLIFKKMVAVSSQFLPWRSLIWNWEENNRRNIVIWLRSVPCEKSVKHALNRKTK